MSQQLEDVLEELGISQYLDAFLDQGFDAWETILDITESDLDALGVKLGHRRKLQRKIANFRGVAPEAALVSPTRAAAEEATRPENTHRHDPSNYSADTRGPVPGVLAKRKYRRHPKPDECAPERPPSAYVLFSNKMREKLKGQNLSFTEIAKLVGENWQTLTPAERKPYETEAQAAKDKYNHAMVLYKKTPEYQRYILYLQEFKARHSNQTQDKDAFKRIKLSDFSSTSSVLSPSATSASPPTHSQQIRQRERSATTSESVCSSDGQHERETPHPPSRRERRVGSTVSASDSRYSSASPTPGPHDSLVDGSMRSPHQDHATDAHPDWSPRPMSMSPREVAAGQTSNRNAAWATDGQPQRAQPAAMGDTPTNASQLSLPSLSDMFDNRQLPTSGLTPSSAGSASPIPPAPGLTGVVGGATESRPSMLRLDQASSGASTSTVSSSSMGSSYPRTPLDGSLPIHALLSGKPPSPSPPPPPSLSHHHRHSSLSMSHSARIISASAQIQTSGPASPSHRHSPPPRPYAPVTNGQQSLYKDHVVSGVAHANGGGRMSSPLPAITDIVRATAAGSAAPIATHAALPPNANRLKLDGVAALLEAGELVDRLV